MNARELLGSTVHDRKGRPVGEVEEIVVDRISGRVSFAVLTIDDDEPHGEYLPVPWVALTVDPESGDLCLRVSARRVADAPTIEADNLDALERRDIGVEVFSYYGVQPPWEGHSAAR